MYDDYEDFTTTRININRLSLYSGYISMGKGFAVFTGLLANWSVLYKLAMAKQNHHVTTQVQRCCSAKDFYYISIFQERRCLIPKPHFPSKFPPLRSVKMQIWFWVLSAKILPQNGGWYVIHKMFPLEIYTLYKKNWKQSLIIYIYINSNDYVLTSVVIFRTVLLAI